MSTVVRLGMCALLASACGSSETPPGLMCADPPRGAMYGGFADATSRSGLVFDYDPTDFKGGGLAVADFDGDGRPDIAAGSRRGGLAVFRNRGAFRFDEVVDSGLDPAAEATALAAADLDNDDDRDLIVAAHGTLRIYANRGDATFDETAALTSTGATEHVLPVDLDGDALLDLYIGNYDLTSLTSTTNQVYMNRGAAGFERVIVDGPGRTWTTTAWDYDADGDLDLYVANDTLAFDFGMGPVDAYPFPVDAFLRNDGVDERGVPRLTNIADELGMTEARSSMGGLVGDFTDDGLLDLYVPNFGANKLFVRDPQGGFSERASALGLAAIARINERCDGASSSENCLVLSWSSALTDFDLDGVDEVLLVNGATMIGGPPPVQLFVREADTYTEVAPSLPCSDARALVTTDIDGDGDPDIVMAPKDGPLAIFENTRKPAAGSSLTVRLRGTATNRDGSGAQVTLRHASGRVQTRLVGVGGVIHSSGPAEAMFGLGNDPIAELTVRWPGGASSTSVPEPGVVVVDQP